MDDRHVFPYDTLRFVCTSDTHNDNPSMYVPDGDIFIHGGDLTNRGTFLELKTAYDWIAALPHPVKVVIAGNNDRGLAMNHQSFNADAYDLYTSAEACTNGIRYVNQEIATIAYYTPTEPNLRSGHSPLPLRIFGNAHTPFKKRRKSFTDNTSSTEPIPPPPPAFIYDYAPSKAATRAWMAAPGDYSPLLGSQYVPIHVTHGPPLGHLDFSGNPDWTGCAEQARIVSRSRPMLCVFGHYHVSWGAEVTDWERESMDAGFGTSKIAVTNAQVEVGRASQGDGDETGGSMLELVDVADGPNRVMHGRNTLFVNASWMTQMKTESPVRNRPFVVVLKLPSHAIEDP